VDTSIPSFGLQAACIALSLSLLLSSCAAVRGSTAAAAAAAEEEEEEEVSREG